jgi:hypothetical protein
VYIVEVTDSQGAKEQHEVVFGKHRDLEVVNRAWNAFGTHLGKAMQMRSMQGLAYQTRPGEYQDLGTALRYEEQMVLRSVAKHSFTSAHYELPQGVERADMQEAPSRSGPPQEDVATETAKKAGDAAKDEAQDSVVDEVRGQVRGVFRKLFD